MTRIGINALFHASGGSLANLRELITHWNQQGVFAEHDIHLYASPHVARELAPLLPCEAHLRVLKAAAHSWPGRIYAEQLQLPLILLRDRIEVLFCPGNTVPRSSPTANVVVFQNAAPFSSHTGLRRVGLKSWVRFRMLGRSVRSSSRRAERILVGSEDFRLELSQRLKLPAGDVRVIPRAVSRPTASAVSPSLRQLPERFVLCVSHLQPYKNILELINGFRLAIQSPGLEDVSLLIAGGVYTGTRYRRRVEDSITRSGLSHRVSLLGNLPANEIPVLLARCELFAFPSTCENCPTALIEAIAARAIIASSDIGAMPEIAGAAATYFDPYDPESIARALRRGLLDQPLREQLARLVEQRATELPGPAEMARMTLDAILGREPFQLPLARSA